jgi:chromosomal replication initiation ATPase DnaA
MDRFLKTKERKTPSQNFAEADVICLWGPPGIGKTHLVEQTGGIWLGEDTLRSKQNTLEFIGRVRSADRAVIIDDFESVADLVGLRESLVRVEYTERGGLLERPVEPENVL